MRIALSKYGWPQVVTIPAFLVLVMCILFLAGGRFLSDGWIFGLELFLGIFFLSVLAFFRDPERIYKADQKELLAPADGRITDIEQVDEEYISCRAIRIGIFMRIFDVHINRCPCDAQVVDIYYKKGRHKNAASPGSARVNEANTVFMKKTREPTDELVVRQISGAIARRIVCKAGKGEKLSGGERFGMVKFGSRVELYVPVREDVELIVKVGDIVKAGLTVLLRYK